MPQRTFHCAKSADDIVSEGTKKEKIKKKKAEISYLPDSLLQMEEGPMVPEMQWSLTASDLVSPVADSTIQLALISIATLYYWNAYFQNSKCRQPLWTQLL